MMKKNRKVCICLNGLVFFISIFFTINTAYAVPGSFIFAVINDTHCGGSSTSATNNITTYYSDVFQSVVPKINKIDPSFVLFPGDLTQSGTSDQYQEFLNIANGINVPNYYTLGNHDKAIINNDGETPYPDYSVDLFGYHFVILNTVDGHISDKQRVFMSNDISTNVAINQPIILVGHYPFFNIPEPYFVIDNWAGPTGLKSEFSSANLQMTISGHYHRNNLQLEDNIHHIVNGACAYPIDEPLGNGFRLVAINGDAIMTAYAPMSVDDPLHSQNVEKNRVAYNPPHVLSNDMLLLGLNYTNDSSNDAIIRIIYSQQTYNANNQEPYTVRPYVQLVAANGSAMPLGTFQDVDSSSNNQAYFIVPNEKLNYYINN